MGDPKKQRKKYSTPSHPWQKERIDEEKALMKEYGFKNKREILKISSILNKYKQQAKRLIALPIKQAEIEQKQLIQKLFSLGITGENAKTDDILSLSLKDLIERRLQTRIYRQNMAKSVRQARQYITHNHIMINDKLITSPSYLVKKTEESLIKFVPSSSLSDPEHPERKIIEMPKIAAKKGISEHAQKSS